MDKFRKFWEKTLVSESVIKRKAGFAAGSREYFDYYDKVLRGFDNWAIETGWYNFNNSAGKRVLDVGCGNGWVSSRYHRNKAKVTAFDISERAVRLSKLRFNYRECNNQVNFLVCDVSNLPFKGGAYDIISGISVLHNVPDFSRAIEEIARICKKGAKLFIMVFYKNSFFYRIVVPVISLLRRHPRQLVLNSYDGESNPLTSVFSKNEIRNTFSKFSIRLIDFSVNYLPREHLPLPEIKPFHLLRDLLAKKIGFYLYVRAVKE